MMMKMIEMKIFNLSKKFNCGSVLGFSEVRHFLSMRLAGGFACAFFDCFDGNGTTWEAKKGHLHDFFLLKEESEVCLRMKKSEKCEKKARKILSMLFLVMFRL